MKLEEQFLIHYLEQFDKVPFTVIFEGRVHNIGKGEPKFEVEIKKEIPKKDLMESTSLALGEAYMRGDLIIKGELYPTLEYFLSQIKDFKVDHKALKKILFVPHTKVRESKDVQSHYDIGNDFYKMWLDETMSYSCGYFKKESDSLYEAQVQKVDYILEKLYLKENMTLLDIGCGWGFLLIEAAKKYKTKGLGITLSKEQFDEFESRIKKEGLEDYLEVMLLDYHDLPKLKRKFDRVVSVGMLEHVGRENYSKFIKIVGKIMEPSGLFLLHYISGQVETQGDPWIKKYIFPGGLIPTLREIVDILPEEDFHVLDIENLRLHYYKTLMHWNDNFEKCKDQVREERGEEFARMRELYLCSCAAGFHNGVVSLHQILCSKGINNDLPMTRWY